MKRDGQEDQVTANIQIQMKKDGTTSKLNKNKREFKIRELLTATGSTVLFYLRPQLQSENIAYKNINYKRLNYKTIFLNLHFQDMYSTK